MALLFEMKKVYVSHEIGTRIFIQWEVISELLLLFLVEPKQILINVEWDFFRSWEDDVLAIH